MCFDASAQSTSNCSASSFDADGNMSIGSGDLLALLSFYGLNLDQDSDGILDCEDSVIADSGDCPWSCGDGQIYHGYLYETVQIGDQCWFAENLRTETYASGEPIETALFDVDWSGATEGLTTVYGEGPGYCQNYCPEFDACDESSSLLAFGRLYNWYAVDDARGLCPSGWHVPSDEEWSELENFVASQGFEGTEATALKATSGWSDLWISEPNGSDDFGFSATPSGFREVIQQNYQEGFTAAGASCNYWSSSPDGTSWPNVWTRSFSAGWTIIFRNSVRPDKGKSVRCIRTVLGCTDTSACNYDLLANSDDGSCTYAEAFYDCEGNCLYDADGDGVCDELETFQCGGSTAYQGYDYATVLIGEQCWFAENLRSENYENGDAIPANLSSGAWSSTSSGAVAVHGEGSSTCYSFSPDGDACDEEWSLNEYGRLYNWYAVDDARGLCPSGWHVPTNGEWTMMTDFLGGDSVAAGQMKTTYGWYFDNGTNSSGFSGLPSGRRNSTGDFENSGIGGYLWSSSSWQDSQLGIIAYFRALEGTNFASQWSFGDYIQAAGMSVRCIQSNDAVSGCTDTSACNYDLLANSDAGPCTYAETFYDCDGVCINDTDGDGVCDELEPPGEFSCGNDFAYQGHSYATVLIGEQCWFAENLRNANYTNGDAIPAGLSDTEWSYTTTGAVAVYGEDGSDCESLSPDGDACDEAWSLNEYGHLYNGYAVDDARGLCPSGWHVPTDEDLMTLTDFLGGVEVAGLHLKADFGWSNGNSGTNWSGFSGLPGGRRNNVGNFEDAGGFGWWWRMPLSYILFFGDGVYDGTTDAHYGFSVRCVKDVEP